MKKYTGTILLILFITGNNYAQVPFFQHYSLLRRSEPVQVNVIFQDKSGLIWYGTNKGLFSFDGINQKRFTVSDSLPDNNVTAIGQDSSGRIWTGHKNGKLAFFDKGIVTFDPSEGSSTNEVSDILFDRNGTLWFSTLNDGLYYFTQDRLFRIDKQEGLPDIFVYDIMEDPGGNIWAGTDGGVAICTLNDKKVSIKVLNYDQGLPDNIVKKLVLDKDNTVWMGTEDAGVVSFSPSTGKPTPLILENWKFGTITDFLLKGDQLWISSLQSGLIVYDLKTNKSKVYNENTGVDFLSINTLLTDQEGNIWIGTKSGVMRTLGDQVEYIETFDPYTDTNILALTVDKENNLWFSTGEGLFKRRVDESGKISINRQLIKTQFKKHTTISLYTDSDGYIWAGLYGEGVLRINPRTGKIRYLSNELRNGNVLNITGRGNVVWLATLGGGTKIMISGEQLEIKNYGREEGLVSEYIYQVFVDSQERVWFATDGKGVGMLDKDGMHHIDKGLNSKVVYGFAEDSSHRIWVNVQGEGLYKLDGEIFHALSAPATLRDRNVNCFSLGTADNLMVMHDLGIDVYDSKRNKIRYLGDEVGIQDKRPNLNALAKDREGRIYIGTDRGIIKYSDLASDLLTSPTPHIEELKVLDQKIDLSESLTFKYNKNSVIIHYLGFWYQNPGSLSYQYQLENYDRDWIVSRDRSATYSSLPPGKYTFRLRVSDTEDFSAARESTFSFTIRPPFWRTAWFYLFVTIAVVLTGAAYIRYREKRLLEDKRILEEKVMERTLEIQKQTEEIQAQNEEIQSQAEEILGINDNLELLVKERTAELEKKNKASEESAFIIAHELRAPVASVLGLINLISKCELNDEARTIVSHMEDSAERLNVVVRNITKAIERGDKK